MTIVSITSAPSHPITILVNMPEYVERVRLSSLTPLYHVIALLINFLLTGLKLNLYYKCICIHFLMLSNVTYLILLYMEN